MVSVSSGDFVHDGHRLVYYEYGSGDRPFLLLPGLLLPQTERISQRVMVLPTGTAVDPAQIRTICSLIRFAVTNGAEIRRRAASRR